MEYRLKKHLMAGDTILYNCPACHTDLESKLKEAGTADACPICGGAFVVPGKEELVRREQEAAQLKAAAQERATAEAASAKAAAEQAALRKQALAEKRELRRQKDIADQTNRQMAGAVDGEGCAGCGQPLVLVCPACGPIASSRRGRSSRLLLALCLGIPLCICALGAAFYLLAPSAVGTWEGQAEFYFQPITYTLVLGRNGDFNLSGGTGGSGKWRINGNEFTLTGQDGVTHIYRITTLNATTFSYVNAEGNSMTWKRKE